MRSTALACEFHSTCQVPAAFKSLVESIEFEVAIVCDGITDALRYWLDLTQPSEERVPVVFND